MRAQVAAAWADHDLTDVERATFEREGYLVVPGALAPELVEAVTAVAQRELEAFRASGVSRHAVLNRHDLVGGDAIFLELVDHATVLPKVVGVLGWNIQLFHTQLIVAPPAPSGAARGGYAWHQDNNRMNQDFETPAPHPRVSVKVGYLVTDASHPGGGNLCVVPGSHRTQDLTFDPRTDQPAGAIEVTGAAGDAVLFDRRLWHAASANHGPSDRILLTYGYSYRWLRPKSEMDLAHLFPELDPVRRQLLGHATSANGRFDPQPEDVPLRELATGRGDPARPGRPG